MNGTDLIRAMTEAAGPSGYEGEIKELIRKGLQGLAEFSQDNLGSLICKKKGSSETPKIMIPGHMDEIGFMVNTVNKNGFIKFIPLGGWWDQVMLAQRVTIKTGKGDLPGVIGSIPPHMLTAKQKEKVVEKKEMFIDIGALNKDEALAMGVQPGDPIVPQTTFAALGPQGKILMNKALDNRLGCCLFMETIRALQGVNHPNTVYGVGTVQEEVGLRGATTAANVVEPDICITVDVTVATDVPGLEKEEPEIKLGAGPVLTLADASAICNRGLRDLIIGAAKEKNIPLQINSLMGGGTDAGAVQKFGPGVPSIVLSIPTRYIHSHYGIIHLDDYENAQKLLLEAVGRLDQKTVENIKKSN